MQNKYFLLSLLLFISGCTAAFEVGEALNRATSNIANDPKVLWSTAEPASAPVATTVIEPEVAPAEAQK